jgi:orotate phosphoribosyltransferase
MNHPELARVLLQYAYLERLPPLEPFVLSSGRTSRHYFDCERATAYAPALPLIGKALYELLDPRVVCIGGPTRGADPIADAVAYYSASQARPVNTFSVRKEPKKHGTGKWIEGLAQSGETVAFVDDVVTSGGSVLDAMAKCREEGLQVVQVFLLVDRQEGGMERLQQALSPAIPVQALYRYNELVSWWKGGHGGSEPAAEPHRELAPAV